MSDVRQDTHDAPSFADQALAELARLGSVCSAQSADEMPKRGHPGHFVYLVTNGDNVIQLGQGNAERMRKCTRGELAGKHNKAFICAMSELAFGTPNRYFFVECGPRARAVKAEASIHRALGIRTNRDGATLINGCDSMSIRGIQEYLWPLIKATRQYGTLDDVERLMAEELFQLMTYGQTKVKRSGGVITSKSGDNLEGNILMNVNKAYLANVFSKLSQSYLRYGKHLLTESEYSSVKKRYEYSPMSAPFIVFGDSSARG